MPSSFDGHIFEDHLLEALQVRSFWNLYRLSFITNFFHFATYLKLLFVDILYKSLYLEFNFFFLFLQLDGMILEDPAVVQPCVTVLQRLNAQIYSGLKSEMQVNLVHLMGLHMIYFLKIIKWCMGSWHRRKHMFFNIAYAFVIKL